MTRLSFRVMAGLLLAGLLLAGCNAAPAELAAVTPALSTASPTATVPPSVPTPTHTPPAVSQITPASSPTPVTPSATPTITNTPGPYEHVIQAGEGLIGIVVTYGHYDLGVLDVVVALNANMSNPDQLPPPGSTILIPRPSPTATPPGGELTATLQALRPPTATPQVLTGTHVVEANQTIIGIALNYNTTMAILARLNPNLWWYGCDFSVASGGDECAPPLNIGDVLTVPLPTPTPSSTPTPSGNETPTRTPTPGPVQLLWPSAGSIISGGPLVLRWVSAGVLPADALYQVTVTDTTQGIIYTEFTHDNTLTLPYNLIPADEGVHQMAWEVTVVQVGNDQVAFRVGAPGIPRDFQWLAAQ